MERQASADVGALVDISTVGWNWTVLIGGLFDFIYFEFTG